MSPQLVLDRRKVAQYVTEKQELEVMLAWDLLEIFNKTDTLIGPLRAKVHAAMWAMLHAYLAFDWLHEAITTTVGNAKKEQLRMARALNENHPPTNFFPALRCHSLQHMAFCADNFDLQDCCWVIRMYGEFVERAAKVIPPAGGAATERRHALDMLMDQIKTQYRRGFQWKLPRDKAAAADLAGMDGFVENYLQRARYNLNKPAEASNARDVGGWLAESLSQPHQFVNSLKGGISIFRPKPSDTTLKIDRVFGLMPGATISGTTTDLMYFMDTFGAGGRDPIYYLAAAAAIVSQGHHTLLEVALPLTMNGWADYSIGYYTSLMPTGHREGRVATSHPAQGAIWDVLDAAEHHRKNRFMLVFYDAPRQIQGCYLFEHGDARFKLMATADDNLATTFTNRFLAWPTYDHVNRWYRLYYGEAAA